VIKTEPRTQAVVIPIAGGSGLLIRCPHCNGGLLIPVAKDREERDAKECPNCKFYVSCQHGIWRALRVGRALHFAQFIADYEFIRAAEGRGSDAADYYLALPDRDLSGKHSSQWAIRAATFHHIEREILPSLSKCRGQKLRVLDLGAGNCWMSYRLALAGHLPVAVDLLTNCKDGLGAGTNYRGYLASMFLRVQAELDRLPFPSESFDVVIFNASFHYSENYETTLAEAIRCTRSGGIIVIADTPWYARDESGRQMVAERRAHFTAQHGFASDSIPNREYITDEDLHALSDRFAIDWKLYTPYYGFRWMLRPWLAKLRGHRAPSRFRIYVAQVRA